MAGIDRISGIALRSRRRALVRVVCAACLPLFSASLAAAEPLLPDMIVWARDTGNPNSSFMYGGEIDTTTIKNQVLYRFHGVLPNIGAGPLEVREEFFPENDNTQVVYQRIYDSVLEYPNEVLLGSFPDATFPPCCHLFLPGIAQYNLRTVVGEDGVGPIVSSTDKTSMAVVDSIRYDTSLPGAPISSVYDSVLDDILGISVGWGDRYSRGLPNQWVDLTGLPSDQYWLEVIVDPYNRIVESDDSNNTERILLDFTIPAPQIHPGDYNDDGTVDAADYTVWRDTLGQSVELGAGADGDGNGTIGQSDYDVWRVHYGETVAGSGSITAAVPEPSGGCLVMAGFALLAAARRARTA